MNAKNINEFWQEGPPYNALDGMGSLSGDSATSLEIDRWRKCNQPGFGISRYYELRDA